MVESIAADRNRRVLVALDAASWGTKVLEAGVRLASALGARLEGLFVEDADLVHLAGLPFARELSIVTGAWRGLAAEDVERALRVEAAKLERLLADAAQQAQVPWSFTTARGRLIRVVAAREAELTVLAGRPAAPAAAERRPAPRSLAVVFDGSSAAFRALEVGGRFADALRCELRVLVSVRASPPVAAEARAWLAARSAPGLAVPLPGGEAALAQALQASRSELLIQAAPDVTSLDALARLLDRLPCPLLIVR